MKLKFMTPREASNDQHRLKEKIEKERIEKKNKYKLQKEGKLKKKKGSKRKDDGKGSTDTRCLIEGHPCLVVFVYESENNVVSQRLVEKL